MSLWNIYIYIYMYIWFHNSQHWTVWQWQMAKQVTNHWKKPPPQLMFMLLSKVTKSTYLVSCYREERESETCYTWHFITNWRVTMNKGEWGGDLIQTPRITCSAPPSELPLSKFPSPVNTFTVFEITWMIPNINRKKLNHRCVGFHDKAQTLSTPIGLCEIVFALRVPTWGEHCAGGTTYSVTTHIPWGS